MVIATGREQGYLSTGRLAELERPLFYLATLLCALPLLVTHHPPLVDLPQHAAQIATLARMGAPDFLYAELYELPQWWLPYRGGYSLLWLLHQVLPILAATKILLAATLVAIPLTASRLRRHWGGEPYWDWLVLTAGYGFAFQWGFLNFFVTVPFVLAFFVLAFRYAEQPTLARGLGVAASTMVLFYMHILAAAFACGMALLYVLGGTQGWRRKCLVALPLFTPLPFALAFIAYMMRVAKQASESGDWGLSLQRPLEFLSSSIGSPRFEPPPDTDYRFVVLGAVFYLLPLLSGARFTRDRRRWLLWGAYLLFMLAGPNFFLGNYYNYQRFAIYGMPLYLMLLERPEGPPGRARLLALLLCMALPLGMIANQTRAYAAFDREARGYRELVSQIPPDRRIYSLIADPDSTALNHHSFVHLAAWYQAETRGVMDYNFARLKVLLTYTPESQSTIRDTLAWHPKRLEWDKHRLWRYDYFLVKDADDQLARKLLGSGNCPVELITRSDDWWLYRTDLGEPDDPQSCAALRLRREPFLRANR